MLAYRHTSGFKVFQSVQPVARILFLEFAKKPRCQRRLIFTTRRESQNNFGKWSEVPAACGSSGHLSHADIFVSVNSVKPQAESRTRAQRADNVIGDAKRNVGICRVRVLRQ